jgi:hypothetical protein
MINKQIMNAWNQKNNSTIQRKYQIIKDKRKKSNNMLSQEDAACICASEAGVDLHKYLPKEEVSRISDLNISYNSHHQTPQSIINSRNSAKDKKNHNSLEKVFNFDKQCLEVKDSLLPKKFAEEAKEMMLLYAKTYIFENSVRNVIRIVMIKKYGSNWWNQVDINIQNKILGRKKQEKTTPWISKRGEDELCYSDVSHLKKIIDDNWAEFSLLGNKSNLFSFFDLIEKTRNIIAHHNFVEKDDEEALNVYLKNWTKAVETNKDNLK